VNFRMSLVIGVSIGNHVTGRLTAAAHLCFSFTTYGRTIIGCFRT
jgi:hypothetical protein